LGEHNITWWKCREWKGRWWNMV